jgi:hypothetical protein
MRHLAPGLKNQPSAASLVWSYDCLAARDIFFYIGVHALTVSLYLEAPGTRFEEPALCG